MKLRENNFAFIDGANLYEGMKTLGWKLDYQKFRVWLKEKYMVNKACVFIGMIPKFKDVYTNLQEHGYNLIFKEVIYQDNKPKGNCDGDLIVKAMEDSYENNFDKAILVSSDGDYASLVNFLKLKNKFKTILSPATKERCSILLKRTSMPIVYLNDKKSNLEYIHTSKKEKAPDTD